MCTELLSETSVGSGHVCSQTVLHLLQERHPALTLLLKALLPQCLSLQLTANTETNQSQTTLQPTKPLYYCCTSSTTDLQASSALAEVSAQQRLRRCRRRAAASPRVRQQLSSFRTSRSADRPLSSRRPDCKHMVAAQTQRDHNNLNDRTHAITAGDTNMLRTCFVIICAHKVSCYFEFCTFSFNFLTSFSVIPSFRWKQSLIKNLTRLKM